MVDVETVQLAVSDEIDPRQLLRVEHDGGGILERLLARQRRQPVGDRVAANNGGLDEDDSISM